MAAPLFPLPIRRTGCHFNLAGGGVFAMKWDTDGIRMCQSHVGTLFLWIKLSQWLGNWNRAMIPSESVGFLKLLFGLVLRKLMRRR